MKIRALIVDDEPLARKRIRLLAQDEPDAMFQAIIYDGLLGTGYLQGYAVAFDVAGGSILLAEVLEGARREPLGDRTP